MEQDERNYALELILGIIGLLLAIIAVGAFYIKY